MPLSANQSFIRLISSWLYAKANTGFASSTQKGKIQFLSSPSATTYNHVYQSSTTLAAAANTTIDFYSFTSSVGEAVTATKLLGVQITATATVTGGQLKIEPGASNPLDWPFSGTTPAITLTVGTSGACVVWVAGTTQTLSSTIRNWKISNPGSQSVTVTVVAFVGA
jgi:hypothetical protein